MRSFHHNLQFFKIYFGYHRMSFVSPSKRLLGSDVPLKDSRTFLLQLILKRHTFLVENVNGALTWQISHFSLLDFCSAEISHKEHLSCLKFWARTNLDNKVPRLLPIKNNQRHICPNYQENVHQIFKEISIIHLQYYFSQAQFW